MPKSVFFLAYFLLFCPLFASSQHEKSKRPSPPAQAQCKFPDGKSVTIDYSSPRAKGRKIYGGLVPYGDVWRLGANEATALVTDTDVELGGKDVAVGSYTLFVTPNPDRWTLIISKKTGEWGIPYPEGDDLARTDMSVSKTSAPVENFTIGFDQQGSKCIMHVDWETTRASIQVDEKR